MTKAVQFISRFAPGVNLFTFIVRPTRSALKFASLSLLTVLSTPVIAESVPNNKSIAPPDDGKITLVPYLGPTASKSIGQFSRAANSALPQTGGFDVDVNSRQQSQAFFNSVYTASENTNFVFTGQVSTCSPGITNDLFKDAVALRINWFREMAGVGDNITFRSSFNSDAQDAALIMAANSTLTHHPDSSLSCYTASGEDGAGSSNLALGTLGWEAIDGYIADPGAGNKAVGHRRWLLHPPIEQMGSGDIPAIEPTASTTGTLASNAVWVIDENISAYAPARDGYVAWPSPGFVPYQVVPARWSFSLKGANFNNTTVSMTRNGSPVSATLEPLSVGAGLETLVWVAQGLDPDKGETWPKPAADETIRVQVSNVLINGTPQNFAYNVLIFDSAVAGANDQLPTISGPQTGELETPERFDFTPVSFVEGYNLRQGKLTSFTAKEGAEGSQEFVTDLTDGAYPLFTTDAANNGSLSLHLAHSNGTDQHLIIERHILPSSTSELRFASRLGYAVDTQIALAQVSLDDGLSWIDVYTQAGSGGRGETSFNEHSVALADYAGSFVKLRFSYKLATPPGESYFSGASAGAGFYIDDIEVTNAEELTEVVTTTLSDATEFSFSPDSLGEHVLQIQPVGFAGFAGSAWGPMHKFQANGSNNNTAIAASVLPASRSVFNTTATAFATIINGGANIAMGCRLVPQTNTATTFSYQTTSPADNSLTGSPDTPADIEPGAAQTFAFFFEPTQAFSPTEVVLSFDCANSAPAPVFAGLNTLLLASGSGPVPDIIALAATSASGIVDIPGEVGTGVFAVATVNAGAGATITVSTAGPSGVSVQLCETNPTTGACISAVGQTVTTTIESNMTPTFGFFVTGSGNVPFDPANNRVSVVFADDNGVTRGATSVAIRTN